ncbi:hypothetical protein Anas_02316 [Armadillidium nasatum]|uniref:Uncharacterized protein n=1 Tax=Armadillidium nasatum TaxID=96803 RepID=A0A5N5TNI3_9CRUS|nr:hypothetical protein Anas_02316 [Armadillidium nasatum]
MLTSRAYNPNGNRHWRRRFFHFVTFVEGLILLILYSISSNHNLLIQMIGISSVTLTFLIGVIILEYGKSSAKNTKTDVELGNANHLQAKITASTATAQNDQNNVENLESQPHPQAEESSVSSSKDREFSVDV